MILKTKFSKLHDYIVIKILIMVYYPDCKAFVPLQIQNETILLYLKDFLKYRLLHNLPRPITHKKQDS